LSVVKFQVEYGPLAHSSLGHLLLFGAAHNRSADVALKLRKTSDKMKDCFDLILSINHLNKMCRDVTKVSFSTHPEQHRRI
jgi:hypothetical protein